MVITKNKKIDILFALYDGANTATGIQKRISKDIPGLASLLHIQSILKEFFKEGYVLRERKGRENLITLTEKGNKMVEALSVVKAIENEK